MSSRYSCVIFLHRVRWLFSVVLSYHWYLRDLAHYWCNLGLVLLLSSCHLNIRIYFNRGLIHRVCGHTIAEPHNWLFLFKVFSYFISYFLFFNIFFMNFHYLFLICCFYLIQFFPCGTQTSCVICVFQLSNVQCLAAVIRAWPQEAVARPFCHGVMLLQQDSSRILAFWREWKLLYFKNRPKSFYALPFHQSEYLYKYNMIWTIHVTQILPLFPNYFNKFNYLSSTT